MELEGRLWYCCPYCGKKLFPVGEETRVYRLPYWCKRCKRELEVNIESH